MIEQVIDERMEEMKILNQEEREEMKRQAQEESEKIDKELEHEPVETNTRIRKEKIPFVIVSKVHSYLIIFRVQCL